MWLLKAAEGGMGQVSKLYEINMDREKNLEL
jgi:hypothetical protein